MPIFFSFVPIPFYQQHPDSLTSFFYLPASPCPSFFLALIPQRENDLPEFMQEPPNYDNEIDEPLQLVGSREFHHTSLSDIVEEDRNLNDLVGQPATSYGLIGEIIL